MITDLFSHKIHSSGNEWPDKLVELTFLFEEFDGKVYEREKIEKRLLEISPRSSYAPRDRSKFRDEISAYPAYLGLYQLDPSDKGWIIHLSETAKMFLLKEEPDIGSFLRIQLSLFQYPNGMGISYKPKTNTVRIQANARDRTLDFISHGIHLSPMRLICKSLLVEASMKNKKFYEGALTYREIFALANSSKVNTSVIPSEKDIERVLLDFREGRIIFDSPFERRFHILKHTELFDIGSGQISFRTPVNDVDERDLISKINAISKIRNQFNLFDEAKNGYDLERVVKEGGWANYFDGVITLNAEAIAVLSSDIVKTAPILKVVVPKELEIPLTYPLREKEEFSPPPVISTKKAELADPEVTRIKRQRRNLGHKILIDKLVNHLKKFGAKPMENPHIDLYSKIPNDGSFIFEVKSGGENTLDQVRKGISQLYEYRFRYRELLENNPELCLLMPEEPKGISWLSEYVCLDRGICLCWFDEKDELIPHNLCKVKMDVLIGS